MDVPDTTRTSRIRPTASNRRLRQRFGADVSEGDDEVVKEQPKAQVETKVSEQAELCPSPLQCTPETEERFQKVEESSLSLVQLIDRLIEKERERKKEREMSEVELEEERPSPHIFIPDTWIEAADSIAFDSTTAPIAFVCGPKNTGKSTFSRHLLNTLLNRYRKVAYLDTDVGQPEFTTPGCLSLHVIHERTPDLTILSLKTPERCLFFGDTSSKRDPKTYLDNILRLYDYFHTEYYQSNELKSPRRVQLPLVINTAGWVKGIGYDILVEMLRHISPTHVVKMRVSVESKNLPSGAFWFDDSQKGHVSLIEISATFRDSLKRSVIQKDAHLLRDTRIMAYFRQCFPHEMNITTSEELAHALASHPPYEVPIAKIKIMHLHCQVPDSEVSYSLNATIVGLAVSCTKPESSTPWCVGLGIVRAVDISKGLLYVITPVAQHNLEKVDILLQGFIEIPTRLLQVIDPFSNTHLLWFF
ncbi:polynucleotide 5'-hydroxyl-kinase NOL9 [Cinnamomum micranthum f. kanehirae]|uniref:Polynucleotide 5'-hydroxyl-kinase NOL9 n=1 Tax=Cinnamomum micranthum f. kanehirae TaxID=337451 RepID=A0A3S4NQN9_9MAGN|nr:polynucleotide 5'-hydroxyl-kinase NOL9 [Cinnamomum micranthum f. kanehirae]